MSDDIFYIDRVSGTRKTEAVMGERLLRWCYDTAPGRLATEIVIKRVFFSRIYGWLMKLPLSRGLIQKFVTHYNIALDEIEFPIKRYKNFNAFFIRRLKPEARPIAGDSHLLVSPADARLSVYHHIDAEKTLQIKGAVYSLRELLKDDTLARFYHRGAVFIFRLCPVDYHRFHFPDNGTVIRMTREKGCLYSVNPWALKKIPRVFCRNKRDITVFESACFGRITFVDVGATNVGSIVHLTRIGQEVKKGEERGYFEFGGSTVLMFIEKNRVRVDDDLLKNTAGGDETLVLMGSAIGQIDERSGN